MNGEANRARKRQNRATIVADVRRFAHVINTDGVLGTHRRLENLGSPVLMMSPAEFRKLIAEETERWAKVIKFAKIKPE